MPSLGIQTGNAGRAYRISKKADGSGPIGICRAPHAVVTVPLQRPRFFSHSHFEKASK